jgi:hypothetical protein
MLLLSDNSTFKIVPYTLLNRQSTNSTLESPTSEEREKHLESINAAWQRHINLTNIRCILVSLSALPDMAAHKRPFFPGVDEERYTQSKKWTSVGHPVSVIL